MVGLLYGHGFRRGGYGWGWGWDDPALLAADLAAQSPHLFQPLANQIAGQRDGLERSQDHLRGHQLQGQLRRPLYSVGCQSESGEAGSPPPSSRGRHRNSSPQVSSASVQHKLTAASDRYSGATYQRGSSD